jgi:hypothetical protein
MDNVFADLTVLIAILVFASPLLMLAAVQFMKQEGAVPRKHRHGGLNELASRKMIKGRFRAGRSIRMKRKLQDGSQEYVSDHRLLEMGGHWDSKEARMVDFGKRPRKSFYSV